MRITAFWAQGYRSLRDVRIDDFGPYNIFYGKNGAGKSNILAAMEALFKLVQLRTHPELPANLSLDRPWRVSGIPLTLYDRCNMGDAPQLIMGAELRLAGSRLSLEHKPAGLDAITIEVGYDWGREEITLRKAKTKLLDADIDLYRLSIDLPSHSYQEAEAEWRHASGGDRPTQFIASKLGLEDAFIGRSFVGLQPLLHEVSSAAFRLVDADRAPRSERKDADAKSLEALLAGGGLKEGLLRASQEPDPVVRRRYKEFCELITGPPLERPPVAITVQPETQHIELLEIVDDKLYDAKEIPLDLAGLGIAQIYSIVAQALLRGARAVGIEEPEAHLHAPTTGLQLRQLLERLVEEGYIDQLFIATHSNLFDLDPEAYYDVSLDGERGTVVDKKPLPEIDARHLYEPGPAKHALGLFLRYMDEDAVVFRRPDGTSVGVAEMRDMLQRDDPLAVEFLRDVHGAAVRMVQVENEEPGD